MSKLIIADICSINNKGKSVGHYFSVAQNYCEMFDAKCMVAGGPIYAQKFLDRRLALPFDHIECESPLIEKWHELRNCQMLFRLSKGEIVVLQSVSLLTTYIAILLFYHKTSRLYFIQYYTESINSFLKKILWYLIKNKVDGIICSSEKVGLAFDRPFIVMPDYIHTKDTFDFGLPYNERKYDLCFVGRISRDKGQVEALRFFANKGLKIVLAGKVEEQALLQELENIASSDPSIEMILDYTTDDVYYNLLRNSKYCVLNYRGTYNDRSSGVVFDAFFNGTPVIGHKCEALMFILSNKIGYLYDVFNQISIESILNINIFEMYRKNISSYLIDQKQHIIKLSKFLNL